MPKVRFSRLFIPAIPLAAKCRLLFGAAVLLIVASALFVPWLRMRDQVHEANVRIARQMASWAIERVDLSGPGDWGAKQEALDRTWSKASDGLGFSEFAPRLIPLDPFNPVPPPSADRFLRNAIERLAARPGEQETPALIESPADGATLYRVVRAVRADGERFPQGSLLGVVLVDHNSPNARFDLLTNLGIILMAAALAGVLATLVFYLITDKLILEPVRELRRVAEQVSAGNHDVRSTIATGDEYEELARAFNAMLAHLETQRRALETINRSLDTRLGELAELNVKLFEADRMKDHFLANVSHELRTPLTSIIGFAELLREANLPAGGRALRYAENILSSGRMLLAIINDLLDLAKIEAGKMELHVVPVHLRDMADALMDFLQPLAIKKDITLSAHIADEVPLVYSDSGRIQQILYNLLSNAIKFTPENGRVELRISRIDADRIKLAVTDTGVGIPAEKLEHIFETFVQLDTSMTREHSGTGLGLAITRELVNLIGGTIVATSEVGHGSVFTVVLPMGAPSDVVPSTPVGSAPIRIT